MWINAKLFGKNDLGTILVRIGKKLFQTHQQN